MAEAVRVVRLTDRSAPDGTWRHGQIDAVPADVARAAIAARQARLADGETLPAVVPAVAPEPVAVETVPSKKEGLPA